MKKTFLLLLVTAVLLLSCSSTSIATKKKAEPSSLESFTESLFVYLPELSKESFMGGDICKWDDTTDILYPILCYAPNDELNGCVFVLETDNERTGYVQINNFFGENVVVAYSFAGIPACEGMMTDYYKEHRSEYSEKLYYIGGHSYCLRIDDWFYRIDSTEKYSLDEVSEAYNQFINETRTVSLENRIGVCGGVAAQMNRTTYNLVEMSDFTGIYAQRPNGVYQQVTEHCSPTAATNIMNYFRASGDSPLSSSLSNSTVFLECLCPR